MKSLSKAKTTFFLILISIIPNFCHADLMLALENYEKGNFEDAYTQFHELAELGNAQALFNIGVMYFHGQFVEKSNVKAFTWMEIANSFNSYYSSQEVEDQLTPEEISVAQAQILELRVKYGAESYQTKLKPFVCARENYQKSNFPKYQAIKQDKPNAPATARRKQVNGYIQVGYSINEHGDVVDVDLLDEYPKAVGYAVETLRATKNFKYPPFVPDPNQVPLRYKTYSMSFNVIKWNSKQARHSKSSVASFIKMANANHPKAQYLMATAIPALYKAKIDQKKRNELLELSARNGYDRAQLTLGLRLIQDQNCSTSKAKGENWIKHAASNGNEIAEKYIRNYINYTAAD